MLFVAFSQAAEVALIEQRAQAEHATTSAITTAQVRGVGAGGARAPAPISPFTCKPDCRLLQWLVLKQPLP